MLKGVPKLVEERVCQLLSQPRLMGQVSHEDDDALHDHGLVVGNAVAPQLVADHLNERLDVCMELAVIWPARIVLERTELRTLLSDPREILPELRTDECLGVRSIGVGRGQGPLGHPAEDLEMGQKARALPRGSH